MKIIPQKIIVCCEFAARAMALGAIDIDDKNVVRFELLGGLKLVTTSCPSCEAKIEFLGEDAALLDHCGNSFDARFIAVKESMNADEKRSVEAFLTLKLAEIRKRQGEYGG
jgi:hypothetical protein